MIVYERTVYTGGTFDILHAGHVNLFRKIKEMFPDCWLIVGLNTDKFIKSYKGKSPVFNYKERARQIYLSGYVDEVVPNTGGANSKPAILSAEADIIVIGNDWLQKDYCKQMGFDAQWLTDHFITLVYVPHTDGISTTLIKERLK